MYTAHYPFEQEATYSQEWCKKTIILAFRRLRQEDCEFKDSLGYIVNSCLKTKVLPGIERYTYNPRYLQGREHEDHAPWPFQAKD
jgi:hypothetical protein